VGYDLAPFAGSVVPWMVLQGEVDQVCDAGATRAFVAATGSARLFSLPRVGHGFGVPARWQPQFLEAYRAIAESRPSGETPRAAAPAVSDLSLVEVPATGASGNTMAVFLTGDGGWADMDKTIAARLAAVGIPVVGWSSLEYYWTPRTPESAAGRPRADREPLRGGLAAGTRDRRRYSFGADVAAFLVNRLARAAKSRVARVCSSARRTPRRSSFMSRAGSAAAAILGIEPFRRSSGFPRPSPASSPATKRTLFVGAERTAVPPVVVGRGHHFGDEYERLVELILK